MLVMMEKMMWKKEEVMQTVTSTDDLIAKPWAHLSAAVGLSSDQAGPNFGACLPDDEVLRAPG